MVMSLTGFEMKGRLYKARASIANGAIGSIIEVGLTDAGVVATLTGAVAFNAYNAGAPVVNNDLLMGGVAASGFPFFREGNM